MRNADALWKGGIRGNLKDTPPENHAEPDTAAVYGGAARL